MSKQIQPRKGKNRKKFLSYPKVPFSFEREVFRGRTGALNKSNIIDFCKRYLKFDVCDLLRIYTTEFNHRVNTRGKLQAVKFFNQVYNYALRYSCYLEVEPLPFVVSDGNGFPKLIKEFRKPLRNGHDSRRAALTVLQFHKLVEVESDADLSSIEATYEGQENPEWLIDFKKVLEREFPSSKLQSRINQLQPSFHISGRNGPNGPCIGAAYVDREAIRNTNIEQSARDLASLTGFIRLNVLMDLSNEAVDNLHHKTRQPEHSRIRYKCEPGGKTRPFCIVDFFSQSALKSIHDFSMNWLGTRLTDGTNDHAKAAQTARGWSRNPNVQLWSYDLTKATDRFPVFLQELVLTQMFGHKIAAAWKDLICNRDFLTPEGEYVRFNAGQPLGALSSWAVFAITHHILVQTAAYRTFGSKTKWFMLYRMIGDDVCIARSKNVAQEYKSFLDSLKVDISINKSILPKQCLDGNACELAKRLFHKGIEVTPVPPKAIIESSKSIIGYKNLLEVAWDRGYISAGSPYPVQSALTTKLEYACYTFPLRNRTAQFPGVVTLYPWWDAENDDAPAGLNPYWFIWADCPEEIIIKACRRFLFGKVDKAIEKSTMICQTVLLARYMASARDDLPKEAGDWHPGTFDVHPDILSEVFNEISERLMVFQSKLWDDEILIGSVSDLYVYIGNLHQYLEPEILLNGRDHMDVKAKTALITTSLIKYVSGLHKSGDFTILDTEPELSGMPMLDDFGFAPVNFPFEEEESIY
jgi:hypothetical protein